MRIDEIDIHKVQIMILRELLFKPNARFSDLNVTGLTNDHFTFHLERLIEENLVVKEDQRYNLTTQGKEFANRMDTDRLKMERQAKIACVIIGVRARSGVVEYLVHKRLKEPYYGFWGLAGGKMRWGEKVEEAARREFQEETGLTGDFTLKGVEHKMDFSSEGELLEDKFFMVFRVDNVAGNFIERNREGENRWFTQDEIGGLDLLFDDVPLIIDMIHRSGLSFSENSFVVKHY